MMQRHFSPIVIASYVIMQFSSKLQRSRQKAGVGAEVYQAEHQNMFRDYIESTRRQTSMQGTLKYPYLF
jgi:hypothetical protein